MLLTDLALLCGGLALLTFAADRFVLGAARLSTALRISAVIVGAVVIGFGTSAPELLVTVLATVQGSQDLAFGNIVGSNTANVLLVLGAAGLMAPLTVRAVTLRRELPLMLAAVALLALLTFDLSVRLLDAVLLLAGTAAFLVVMVRTALADREAAVRLEAEVAEYERESPPQPGPALVLALLGLVGTLVGAQLLVSGAVGVAVRLGVSQAAIGLTVVAVGTSLPELVTAVTAARRSETDLVVGNVLGSNVFNSLPVAGVAGLLDTALMDPAFRIAVLLMVAACALTTVFLLTGRVLRRGEAAVLLGLFVVATAITF